MTELKRCPCRALRVSMGNGFGMKVHKNIISKGLSPTGNRYQNRLRRTSYDKF